MHGCIELKTAQTSTVSRCKNMAPLCCKEEEIVSGKKTRKSVLQAQEICADNSSKQKCNKSLELLCKLKHLAGVVIYELLPFTKIQETMHCAQLLNCRAHMLYECTLKSESTSNNYDTPIHTGIHYVYDKRVITFNMSSGSCNVWE